MEIVRNEQNMMVEIWLTNAEKNDRELRESLKPLYQASKKCGYLAVVYESGKDDLETDIYDLLKRNIMARAKRELSNEGKLKSRDAACR